MLGLFNDAWRRFSVQIKQIFRYFGVGIINSVIGYGLYAAFVTLIRNIYLAQLIAHILGMVFNYIMFRTHVFRGVTPSIPRYIAAYAFNYGLGLAVLFGFHHVVASAYLAGLLSLVVVAVINYFILKSFVFRARVS